MLVTDIEAIKYFEDCIRLHGGDYDEWFVGATDRASQTVLDEHNVGMRDRDWRAIRVVSSQAAGQVIEYFSAKGCHSRASADGTAGIYAYIYRKNESTSP